MITGGFCLLGKIKVSYDSVSMLPITLQITRQIPAYENRGKGNCRAEMSAQNEVTGGHLECTCRCQLVSLLHKLSGNP